MRAPRIVAASIFLSGSILAAALAGGGMNFDRLTDADRKVLQARFNKEIWPLLERGGKQGCVGCHMSGKGGNGLRMTGKPDKDFPMLLKKGFFIPDDPGSLLTRIESTNGKRMMPPPGQGKPWPKADIDVLDKFVADVEMKQQK